MVANLERRNQRHSGAQLTVEQQYTVRVSYAKMYVYTHRNKSKRNRYHRIKKDNPTTVRYVL